MIEDSLPKPIEHQDPIINRESRLKTIILEKIIPLLLFTTILGAVIIFIFTIISDWVISSILPD